MYTYFLLCIPILAKYDTVKRDGKRVQHISSLLYIVDVFFIFIATKFMIDSLTSFGFFLGTDCFCDSFNFTPRSFPENAGTNSPRGGVVL